MQFVRRAIGPMHVRIGIMRALNRHVERVFDTSHKEKHWEPAEAGARSKTAARKARIVSNMPRHLAL